MDKQELNDTQLELYQWVMKKCGFNSECVVHSYHFEDSLNGVYTVIESTVAHTGEKTIYSLVALPQLANQVYITFTDQKPTLLMEFIASLSAQSESNDALIIGYIGKIQSPKLRLKGWVGYALHSPDALFEDFDHDLPLDNEVFEFQILTLLNETEYDAALKGGIALVEKAINDKQRVIHSFEPHGEPESVLLGKAANRSPISSVSLSFPEPQAIPDLPELLELDQVVDEVAPALNDAETEVKPRKLLRKLLDLSNEKQVIGETVLGTLLLVGGSIGAVALLRSSAPIISVFPAVFAVAGAITLNGAYKESKSLKE